MNADYFDDSPLHTAALALHVGDYNRQYRHAASAAPFAVHPKLLPYTRKAGLPDPNPGAPPHAHGAHVMFERLNLYVASRVLAGRDWFALYLRDEKVDVLMETPGMSRPTGFFNPILAGKDIARYKKTAAPSVNMPVSNAPLWFAHDVLQHLNAGVVGRWFDSNPTLETLVATIVVPPETLFDLPALTPELYNFEIRDGGKTLVYIPEGNNGGAYFQPVSAREWVRAKRLVTPGRECLHVSLLETNYAHHVLLISRTQLLPEQERVMDMPELTSIPYLAHPFGSAFSRLTIPSLLSALTKYATRVNATGVRDLYSKVAARQAEVYGSYPDSYVRAAVLHAGRQRALDIHAQPGTTSFLMNWFSELVSIPFIPVGYAWQSIASRSFALRLDVGKVWIVECDYLVAASADSTLPGYVKSVCDRKAVPFFYLPPDASRGARLARSSASLHILLVSKFVFYLSKFFIPRLARHVVPTFDVLFKAFDIHASGLPFAVFAIGLAVYFRIPTPPLFLINPFPSMVRAARTLYAMYFMLPCADLPYEAGLSLDYQFMVIMTTVSFLWPHINPISYIVRYKTDCYWLPAVEGFFRVFSLCMLYLSYRTAARKSNGLPLHCPPCDPPYRDSPSSSSCSSSSFSSDSSSGDNDTPLSEFEFEAVPTEAPQPAVNQPTVDEWVELRDFTTRPLTPEMPARPNTPPGIPADPYWRYALRPYEFDSLRSWSLMLMRAGDPPPVLDAQSSCVWQCISDVTGVQVDILHACWLASLSPIDRQAQLAGFVPYAQLPRVFHHFALRAVVYSAVRVEADCPRAIGAQGNAMYDPASKPIIAGQGKDTHIDATFFLVRQGDQTYHLMSHANGNNRVGTEIPDPAAIIGYVSRQLSRVELGSIINQPATKFLRSWIRLDGAIPSAAAVAEGLTSVGLPAFVNLTRRPVERQEIDYVLTAADHDIAVKLGQDIKNKPDVLDLKDYRASDIARGSYELAKAARTAFRSGSPRKVKLHLFHGAPGSGKSYAAQQWLAARHATTPFTNANFRVHTWLNSLRGPLQSSFEQLMPFLQSFNFQTGSMPLAQPLPGTIMFDDATQLWPGFLQLVIASNPGLTDVVLTFDVTQGRTAFPNADSLVRSELSTAEWLAALSTKYGTEMWRLSMSNCSLFGFPLPAAPRPGSLNGVVAFVSNVIADLPLLVVSPRFATSQADSGQRCMTFRECQGFTIQGDVTLDLGGLSATSNDNAWWTALTRARGNMMLFLGPLSSGPGLNEPFYGRSNIASALLAVAAQSQCSVITPARDPMRLVARSVQAHMSRCLSPAAAAYVGLPVATPLVGSRVNSRHKAEWLDSPRDSFLGDYWTARSHRAQFKGFASASSPAFSRHSSQVSDPASGVSDLLRHYASIPNDAKLHSDDGGYVMPSAPVISAQADPALNHGRMRDPDFREVIRGTNSTMQHVEDGPHEILHHTRADRLTASISEQKRINVGVDWGHLSSGEQRRLKQLKRGFGKFFSVPAWNEQGWNANLFERCASEAYAPWCGKRTKKTDDALTTQESY